MTLLLTLLTSVMSVVIDRYRCWGWRGASPIWACSWVLQLQSHHWWPLLRGFCLCAISHLQEPTAVEDSTTANPDVYQ